MPVRSTANARIQIGAEVTPGTGVSAGKIIDAWDVKLSPKSDVKQSTPTGRKYVTAQVLNREWQEWSIDSPMMDYNSVIYKMASVFGAITPTSHSGSSTAKDWSITPPVSGAPTAQTFTVEQGDSVRAHKGSYAILNKFGYKFSKAETSSSASGFLQSLQDNITMTSSPTRVTHIPIAGSHFNLYLDSTYAGLGTTQLTEVMDFEYSFDGVFNPVWYVNRSSSTFTSHVDLTPKATAKLHMEANSNGMALLSNFRNATTLFLRAQAQGPVIDNNQTVSLGSPSGGTFTLTYKGQTTSGLAYNATASAVQTALQGLSTIGTGNATVAGSTGGPYTVTFAGTLATDTTAMTGSGASLTGGTFLITQSQAYYSFIHDMAVKISAENDFDDGDGVFCVPWDITIVEDSGWGKAQLITATNLLTAL